jgi:hypothetical protein
MKKAFSKQIEMLTQIMSGLCDSRRLTDSKYGYSVYNIGGIYVTKSIGSENISIANCVPNYIEHRGKTEGVDYAIELSKQSMRRSYGVS